MDGLCATIVTEQNVECARQKEAGGTAIEEAMCRGKDLRPINDDRCTGAANAIVQHANR